MKNKNINVDMLLKSAMSTTQTPPPELVQKVKYRQIKEEPILNNRMIRRSFSTVAAAVMAFLLITTTAFAAWYFLKPSEVATKFDDTALSAALESESAVTINQSITSGDYTFTLLATVSGSDLTDHPHSSNDEILTDRTYAVLAIQKADGSSMPSAMDDEYINTSFYASPYVKGLKPWQVNAHTMNGGHSEMIVDGTLYRILDCDEVSMFADRGVYLGANTGSFYDSEAFIYNEQTGELKANPAYDGSSVVFDLPLDKSLADPAKAQQYLDTQSLLDDNHTDTGTKRVMTYDEYKAWTEEKLAEAQAMIDQGKYSKSSLELDRGDYESNLKEIKNGATLTMIEYEDGSYSVNITYPNTGFDVSIADDGAILINTDSDD